MNAVNSKTMNQKLQKHLFLGRQNLSMGFPTKRDSNQLSKKIQISLVASLDTILYEKTNNKGAEYM